MGGSGVGLGGRGRGVVGHRGGNLRIMGPRRGLLTTVIFGIFAQLQMEINY